MTRVNVRQAADARACERSPRAPGPSGAARRRRGGRRADRCRASSRASRRAAGSAAARSSATRNRRRSRGSRPAARAAPSTGAAPEAPCARSATPRRCRSPPRARPRSRTAPPCVAAASPSATAEQRTVKLAPAGARASSATSTSGASSPAAITDARDDHRPARGRIDGGVDPATGWRLSGHRTDIRCSEQAGLLEQVLGVGPGADLRGRDRVRLYVPTGGSAGFGATPLASGYSKLVLCASTRCPAGLVRNARNVCAAAWCFEDFRIAAPEMSST